jgi:antitoxin PrlF
MPNVTVSDKGQVVIPASIRRSLGIQPGTQLNFEVEGSGSIRVHLHLPTPASQISSGYGMLVAKPTTDTRKLADFDVAEAMRRNAKPKSA